jgi:two-component system response regulator
MANEKYVLMVEDNDNDVQLTKISFRRCQIPNQLVVLTDGQDALDYLFGQGQYADRDTSQQPALILMDLKLTYMDGLEALKQIRKNPHTSHIPVVITSSTVNEEEIDECKKLGADRFYAKPGGFAEFKKMIEEIRASWLD